MSVTDWRLGGNDFLKGLTLRWKAYYQWSESWDHDHCELCWRRFSVTTDPDGPRGALREGYAVAAHSGPRGKAFPDDYRWICATCCDDLKDYFSWIVIR